MISPGSRRSNSTRSNHHGEQQPTVSRPQTSLGVPFRLSVAAYAEVTHGCRSGRTLLALEGIEKRTHASVICGHVVLSRSVWGTVLLARALFCPLFLSQKLGRGEWPPGRGAARGGRRGVRVAALYKWVQRKRSRQQGANQAHRV